MENCNNKGSNTIKGNNKILFNRDSGAELVDRKLKDFYKKGHISLNNNKETKENG